MNPTTSLKNLAPAWLASCLLIFVVAGGVSLSAAVREPSPAVATPTFPATVLSLTNFGAVGDGKTFCTEAFARAIGALSEKGGGKLVVPPGLWLTGPIKLRSRINLHLERGAVVQFSGDYKRYPLTVIDMKGEKEVDCLSPISGENLEDVAITGAGILDGGGDSWRRVPSQLRHPGGLHLPSAGNPGHEEPVDRRQAWTLQPQT